MSIQLCEKNYLQYFNIFFSNRETGEYKEVSMTNSFTPPKSNFLELLLSSLSDGIIRDFPSSPSTYTFFMPFSCYYSTCTFIQCVNLGLYLTPCGCCLTLLQFGWLFSMNICSKLFLGKIRYCVVERIEGGKSAKSSFSSGLKLGF